YHSVSANIAAMRAKNETPDRKYPEIVAGNNALFSQIPFGQEPKDSPAGRKIRNIRKCNYANHDEWRLPVPRAPDRSERWRDIRLHEHPERDQDRAGHCTTSQCDPQSEQHQRDRQGINMTAISNLPDRKRVPEIRNHPSRWLFYATQEQHD